MALKSLLGITYQDSNKTRDENIPFVLLHGAGSSHLGWPAVFRYMPDRRILSLDLPGHGSSEAVQPTSIEEYAKQLFVFLDHMQIDQVIIAGFSMGAVIAMEMLLSKPQYFSKAIFLSYLVNFNPGTILNDHATDIIEPAHLVDRFSSILFNSAINPAQRDQFAAPLKDGKKLFNDLDAIRRYRPQFHKSAVSVPTLWVFGENDALIETDHHTFVGEQFSNSRIEVISNAGHVHLWEYPDIVLRMIEDFISE